ncbi:MAG: hypothetical protein WA431_08430 [Candidatus Cybelea sp.]
MRISDFSRYVLAVYATVPMLTACGGGAGSSAMPAVSGAANSLPYHKTFSYTGQRQTFTVPADVNWLTVVALGARGAGTDGANGGRVFAVIPVTPGERLAVFVGGEGSGMSGGFNGGGNARGSAYECYCPGYGGGGASDIQLYSRVAISYAIAFSSLAAEAVKVGKETTTRRTAARAVTEAQLRAKPDRRVKAVRAAVAAAAERNDVADPAAAAQRVVP